MKSSAVTIGKFDGVHLGHRRLLDELLQAAAKGLEPVVVTFDRHPLVTIAPDRAPEQLLSSAQRRELLLQAGVSRVIELAFTRELAAMDPRVFANTVLFNELDAREVIVGSDFRFGARGAGTVTLLDELCREHGAHLRCIDDVDVGSERVSSTRIRELLGLGRVREAARLLGREPMLRGQVVRGEQRGRELGFPTANLSFDREGFVPADGVYAGYATVPAGEFPAAISIGNNPTFAGVPERTVEAYLLDVDLDLYDQPMTLRFLDYVRPMLKFDSLDALIAQMHDDVQRTRSGTSLPRSSSAPSR